MSNTLSAPDAGEAPVTPDPGQRLARVWGVVEYVLALGLTLGVLAYLLWGHGEGGERVEREPATPEAVQRTEDGLVRVLPDSPLAGHLKVMRVEPTRLAAPVLMVTGTVAASLRPGNG